MTDYSDKNKYVPNVSKYFRLYLTNILTKLNELRNVRVA
jgi:hypothetical protein